MPLPWSLRRSLLLICLWEEFHEDARAERTISALIHLLQQDACLRSEFVSHCQLLPPPPLLVKPMVTLGSDWADWNNSVALWCCGPTLPFLRVKANVLLTMKDDGGPSVFKLLLDPTKPFRPRPWHPFMLGLHRPIVARILLSQVSKMFYPAYLKRFGLPSAKILAI